jgi:hypothetical protein
MTNPIEIRKRILSAPLRRAGPELLKKTQSSNDREALVAGLMLAYAAAPVFIGNVLLPAKLIDSGFRGERIFSHLSYVKTSLGYPMPRFNYVTPASPAYRTGSRIGGAIGGGVMQGLGHISPLVGWAPGVERGIVKLKLPPWVKKAGVKTGAKIGGRVGARLIPGVGWAMIAYDVYDVAANRSLWGFDLRV